MIPLLLFFLTINFQSDFKGFSSKDEALYYSELLKCEGYFTKNDNEKVFIWPKELKRFKDFNDICVAGNKDKIKPEFILKNTHSGLKAKLLLTEIKNS